MIRCGQCDLALTPAQFGLPCPRCGSMHKLVLGTDQGTSDEVCAAAEELALWHYKIEEGLTHIFHITEVATSRSGVSEPIKLLEVNANTPETGIMPLHFGPAPASGIPYASVIIEVSPNEFERIRSNELKLPEGWAVGAEIPRPADAGAR
jgi:hypothetical protein